MSFTINKSQPSHPSVEPEEMSSEVCQLCIVEKCIQVTHSSEGNWWKTTRFTLVGIHRHLIKVISVVWSALINSEKENHPSCYSGSWEAGRNAMVGGTDACFGNHAVVLICRITHKMALLVEFFNVVSILRLNIESYRKIVPRCGNQVKSSHSVWLNWVKINNLVKNRCEYSREEKSTVLINRGCFPSFHFLTGCVLKKFVTGMW